MDDEKRQQDDWARSRKNRLPSFTEVLSRRTRPPVDLFMFYLFLQREGAEDILDFWLDVQQHENLCRAYFKDVRKSGRTIKDDWPHYWDYARRRGSIYGTRNLATAGDEKAGQARSTSHGHRRTTRAWHLPRRAKTVLLVPRPPFPSPGLAPPHPSST
ncbi:hypothetical protein NLJ89_g5152 [Agrocybe chaxingu]|uniref:RGS domain-containing protein n=1 Tax=Agrocybe chaxingu TaxID=84603 RepID=A0A9W8K1P0_9AGAR|nr:hypothetical protein NLJ89_g5152 [Agrocybe chaxingu]